MTLITAQCTENSSVELLVNDQVWNSTTLYRPKNDHFVVGCRGCNRDDESYNWLYFNYTIPSCGNISEQICTEINGMINNLNFSSFNESQVGEYTCNNVTINVELRKLCFP